MSVGEAVAVERVQAALPEGRSLGWWGVVWTITTESVLFALLIMSYLFIAMNHDHWPTEGTHPHELMKVGVRSVLLLASSIPMEIADKGIQKGSQARLRWGVAGAFLLGLLFIIGHFIEYYELTFKWDTDVYGSLFWTITSFHAAHLIVGLIMLAFVFYGGLRGWYSRRRHTSVKVATLYWHFVDGIWVVVFSTVYLFPHLHPLLKH